MSGWFKAGRFKAGWFCAIFGCLPAVRGTYEITNGYAGSDFSSGKLARYSLVSSDVLNELAVSGIGWDVEYGCKEVACASRGMRFLGETDNILQWIRLARY